MSTPITTEYTVVASISLTLPAESAEAARQLAEEILNAVDGWPTVDIETVEVFA